MLQVGVDCGAHGAIGLLDETAALLMCWDMPFDTVEVGNSFRHRVSPVKLADLLRPLMSGGVQVRMMCEQPTYRPMYGRNRATGQAERIGMNPATMGILGESVGIVKGVAAALGMSYTGVYPGKWKRVVGVRGDKDDAIKRACEVWPQSSGYFARKKDDGRAEACLIAWYGLREGRLS